MLNIIYFSHEHTYARNIHNNKVISEMHKSLKHFR